LVVGGVRLVPAVRIVVPLIRPVFAPPVLVAIPLLPRVAVLVR